MAGSAIDAILKQAETCGDVQVVSAKIENAGADMLRNMGDQIKSKYTDMALVVVLAGVNSNKNQLYCICTKDAVAKGVHAGKIVQKLAALTEGKGGGRPDQAMAGIGKIELLDTAFAALKQTVSDLMK